MNELSKFIYDGIEHSKGVFEYSVEDIKKEIMDDISLPAKFFEGRITLALDEIAKDKIINIEYNINGDVITFTKSDKLTPSEWFDTISKSYPYMVDIEIDPRLISELYSDKDKVEIAIDNYVNSASFKRNGGWREDMDSTKFFNGSRYKEFVNMPEANRVDAKKDKGIMTVDNLKTNVLSYNEEVHTTNEEVNEYMETREHYIAKEFDSMMMEHDIFFSDMETRFKRYIEHEDFDVRYDTNVPYSIKSYIMLCYKHILMYPEEQKFMLYMYSKYPLLFENMLRYHYLEVEQIRDFTLLNIFSRSGFNYSVMFFYEFIKNNGGDYRGTNLLNFPAELIWWKRK